jgi:hypothetical protein
MVVSDWKDGTDQTAGCTCFCRGNCSSIAAVMAAVLRILRMVDFTSRLSFGKERPNLKFASAAGLSRLSRSGTRHSLGHATHSRKPRIVSGVRRILLLGTVYFESASALHLMTHTNTFSTTNSFQARERFRHVVNYKNRNCSKAIRSCCSTTFVEKMSQSAACNAGVPVDSNHRARDGIYIAFWPETAARLNVGGRASAMHALQ